MCFTDIYENKLSKFTEPVRWYVCHYQEKVTGISVFKAPYRT